MSIACSLYMASSASNIEQPIHLFLDGLEKEKRKKDEASIHKSMAEAFFLRDVEQLFCELSIR